MATQNIDDINAALDDIISKRRRGGKRLAPLIDEPLPTIGGGRGGRKPRDFNNSGFGSFGGKKRQFGRGQQQRTFNTAGDDVVWINISNLPETVITGDLQELFQEFNLLGVGVHYDEFGQHMGTADLFVDGRSAKAILQEYANIAIDGQKIRFAIVNEQAAATPQFQNHQRRNALGGNRRQRRRRGGGVGGIGGGRRIRSDSGQSSRTYSRSRSPITRTAGGKQRRTGRNASSANQVKSAAELDRELEAYMNGMKISSDEEGVSSKMIYGGEKSLRSDKMNVDNNSFNEAKKFNPPNIFEPQNSSNNPPTLINQTWDEEELHDDEEEDNEYLLDESLNGISNSLFWTQSISPGKYYNRARGGGQTATPALLSLQRQFATCIIETIQKGIETQPKSDPPTNLSCTKTCSANCSKHIAGNENNSDKEGSDNSSSFSTSSNTNSKISRNNFDSSSNYSPVKKRRRKRRRYQMKSFVRDEIIRKRTHPAALHPDVGFNEPGQLNDGPQCKCSWAAKQTGVRHGKFAGEQPIPLCDWNSSNIEHLYHYVLNVEPNPASLSRRPTQIQIDGHCYKFDGFSVFFHKPLPERFPQRPINQWTQQFQVRFLHENTPESFTIADLELFHKFLFEQVLELYDLNRQINTFKDDNNLFCPFYHCLPRFARTLPDNGKELLPLSSILSHFIGNFVPLVDDRLANYFIQNPLALVDFASQKKGEICLNPKKKPLSIRLDLLEQSLDVKEFYPVITHFGIKPNAYAFLARPQMQEALYKHLQLRKHLTSKSSLTFEEKWMLRKSEAHLNSLKRECKSKRNTVVHVSSRDFFSTGICSDMVLHAILLVLSCQHVRFHCSLNFLEKRMSYIFNVYINLI
ncbi:hypothetical protein Mgra_00006356 [Meloidogyne graminicola]|uniref:RRM domain-containing protein n=1 Tax=Meloidogyne graminicola TaxID=189291 RepID=A0A8S9ZLC9_9BILA|nr:hypothetical protein Mgra_00006356 [Meloidogyne graminicola]